MQLIELHIIYTMKVRNWLTKLLIRETVKSTNSNEKILVAIEKYSSNKSNNQVQIYTYINGGHGYPDYLNLELFQTIFELKVLFFKLLDQINQSLYKNIAR